MQQINYILVNETGSEKAARAIGGSTVPDLRDHSVIVNNRRLSREALINQLVELRSHHPDAKILGISEVDLHFANAPIKVNPWMNEIRLALSELA